MNQNQELKLHDIKEILPIEDFSFFIFLLLIVISGIAFITLLFFIYKIIKNKKNNDEEKYYNILKEIDFNDSKNSAYTITKYGRQLAKSPREKKLFDELVQELESYKYKKEVEELNPDLKAKFSIFMDALDVK